MSHNLRAAFDGMSEGIFIEWLLWYVLRTVERISGFTITRSEVEAMYKKLFERVVEGPVQGMEILTQAHVQFIKLRMETMNASFADKDNNSIFPLGALSFAEFLSAHLTKSIESVSAQISEIRTLVERMQSREISSNSMFRRTTLVFLLTWQKLLPARLLEYRLLSDLLSFAHINPTTFRSQEHLIRDFVGSSAADFLRKFLVVFGYSFIVPQATKEVETSYGELQGCEAGRRIANLATTEKVLTELIAISNVFEEFQGALNEHSSKRLRYTERFQS